MSARKPKDTDTVRMHVQLPRAWRRHIKKAAKAKHLSLSYYVGLAAYKLATDEIGPVVTVQPNPPPRANTVRPSGLVRDAKGRLRPAPKTPNPNALPIKPGWTAEMLTVAQIREMETFGYNGPYYVTEDGRVACEDPPPRRMFVEG